MFLVEADLTPFAVIDSDKAEAMIDDAEAQAMLVAPCIADLDETADAVKFAAVKAILRSSVLRWNDAGSGGVTTLQQNAGPFGQMQVNDSSKVRKGAFWPSEIQRLQDVCADARGKSAFEVDTMPAGAGVGGGSDLLWTSTTGHA